MLDVALGKNCYKNLYKADLTKKTSIKDNVYDVAICAGLFTHGHLDSSAIDECFRVIKKGGLFVSAIRAQVWEDLGFRVKFSSLEESGKIEFIKFEFKENYTNGSRDGRYVIYRKL